VGGGEALRNFFKGERAAMVIVERGAVRMNDGPYMS